MRPNIRLGRIFGIDIGLHYSWLIIALLIVLSLASQLQTVNPQGSLALTWILAGVTAVLFFASILAHELAHALVAKARGMQVRSITLFALGGVSNLEGEPPDAKSEFWMAIVGPFTSLLVGVFFLSVAHVAGWQPETGMPPEPLWAALVWLGYINIVLAVFNLIPGYPLDGGRVLRSIIWAINRNLVRATKIAAVVGELTAIAFIAYGFFRFFTGAGFGGLWLAFIGWFLAEAALATYANAESSRELADIRVRDVMSQTCPAIDGNMALRDFADELLHSGRRCFVVLENGREPGLVTINELKRVERRRWPFVTVADVALPPDRLRSVSPDAPLTQALQLMVSEDLNQLPVMADGKFVGIVNRSDVLQYLQTREELKAA
jgi:Zn-dependent protease/CBS domain-containing protein